MAYLSFHIDCLEGTFSSYFTGYRLVEVSFNILHATGLAYFLQDLNILQIEWREPDPIAADVVDSTDKMKLNAKQSLRIEYANKNNVFNIATRIELNAQVETDILLSELDGHDKLLLRLVAYDSLQNSVKIGQCLIDIFCSANGASTKYCKMAGEENLKLVRWKESMSQIEKTALNSLLIDKIDKECNNIIDKANALFIKVDTNRNYESIAKIPIREHSVATCKHENRLNYFSVDANAQTPLVTIIDMKFGCDAQECEKILFYLEEQKDKELLLQFYRKMSQNLYPLITFCAKKPSIFIHSSFIDFLSSLDGIILSKYALYLCINLFQLNNFYADIVVQLALLRDDFSISLHWFLHTNLALDDEKRGLFIEKTLLNYTAKLKRKGNHSTMVANQIEFIDNFQRIFKEMQDFKRTRLEKDKFLRDALRTQLVDLPPFANPLNPDIICYGIDFDSLYIFKSTQLPVRITFLTNIFEHCSSALFKNGDDLRQDEFCLNLIRFINDLWIGNMLDLEIITYKVLPTGYCQGFIEFVNAESLTKILESNENSVLKYFETLAESVEVIRERFVKSCAGYAAITYLLGVGDRHLDNLMVDHKGRFFHIDYAYILGNDPKPMSSPFKLTAEMIEAMGGLESTGYSLFTSLICSALSILRSNFDKIYDYMNAFEYAELGGHFNASTKLNDYLSKRLKPNESLQQATAHWIKVVKASSNALVPQLIDTLHRWAQDWRE